jgi:ribonucleoside-diphosphate reductase alpha chain
VLQTGGASAVHEVTDHAYDLWLRLHGPHARLPESFIDVLSVLPVDQLKMQAALQPFVDNSISKTINVPEDYPFESFRNLYEIAYDLGLKGCTTFRPNKVTGAVQEPLTQPEAHCCVMAREPD